MTDDVAPSVGCSFYRPAKHEITQLDVEVSASLGPVAATLMRNCFQIAQKEGYRYWAQPAGDGWIVLKRGSGGAGSAWEKLADVPTREAAEMWMLHRAE